MVMIFMLFMGVCGCGARQKAEFALRAELSSVKSAGFSGYKNLICQNTDLFFTEEVVQLLLQNFSFEIVRCNETKDSARAVVKMTNLDMMPVMWDYNKRILGYAVENRNVAEMDLKTVSNDILKELLQSGKYDFITKEVTVEMTYQNHNWEIAKNDDYIDAVFGGLLSNI